MNKHYISVEETKSMFFYVAKRIVESEPVLTKIDAKVGDGDHGIGMARGFDKVMSELPEKIFDNIEDIFKEVGNILLDNMGGASGVLFGTLFISGVVKRTSHKNFDLKDFADVFRISLDAIMKRGRAREGDKTMIDALIPAVTALEKEADEGYDLCDGFAYAAMEARKGMEHTKELKARFGRARYYGDAAIGLQDAGATSVWIIFQSMSEWMSNSLNDENAKTLPLISTLTLNPCIDKTISVSGIIYGGTNRILESRQDLSGKGINVSIALKHLQANTICLGFNYSENSGMVERELNRQGIAHDFVKVKGKLRTNIKLFDESQKVMTEFNDCGEVVDENAMEILLPKIGEYLERSEIMVLNGSVPKGVPTDLYKTIIEQANKKGVRCILDTSGQLLLEGIKAKPYLIKPNLDEFKEAFSEELKQGKEAVEVARTIIEKGVRYVCLSMGSEGAMLISRDNTYIACAPDVNVKGIQGAGDSLVAGICLALSKGACEEDMLRYAVAAAGGSLQQDGTQMCSMDDFRFLLDKVEIQKI